MENIIIEYLSTLKIPISKNYVEKLILSHPDYPSLLSISDVLERLGIETKIGKTEQKALPEIEFPYLIHTEVNGGEFLHIKNARELTKLQKKLDFWNGVILKSDHVKTLKDKENNTNYSEERFLSKVTGLFLAALSVLFIVSLSLTFSLYNVILFSAALIGTITGYFLIAKDLGIKYKAVESFCGAAKNVNCDAVIRSDYSILFGHFKVSDLVFSYFLTQLVVSGFFVPAFNIASEFIIVLGLISLLAIPAVLLSIYYQYVKIKTWCRLCLAVAAILVAQAGMFIYAYSTSLFTIENFSINVFAISGTLFIALNSAVILLKSKLISLNKALQNEMQANRVKLNPQLFTHLLFKERQVNATAFENEIRIGTADAPIQLVMASNLFCNPCKTMHNKLTDLINMYPEKVSLSIRILPVNTQNKEEVNPRDYFIGYWLKNIRGEKNESLHTSNLISKWFETKDIYALMAQYSLRTENENSRVLTELLYKHDAWVKNAQITKTPTLFLNGHEMPHGYDVEDLKAMVPGLAGLFHMNNESVLQ